jgi:hypothetical protein
MLKNQPKKDCIKQVTSDELTLWNSLWKLNHKEQETGCNKRRDIYKKKIEVAINRNKTKWNN